MRSAHLFLLTAILLPSVSPNLFADAPSTLMVRWSEEVRSPGICVDRTSWFVSVIPRSVDLDRLVAPVLDDGTTQVGSRILHLDPYERLCLLEATEEGLASHLPVPLADGDPPKAGDRAKCVSGNSTCRSTVAGKDWSYRGERFPLPLLRLRVSESPDYCNAGTALVSEKGDLLAILTGLRIEATGEAYAIPAPRVRKLVEDIKRHHRSGPIWIGLTFHNESSTPEVLEVKPGSPAADAGVRPGDVILAMNGASIESLDDLVEPIHTLPAGEKTAVRVLRGLEEESLSMTTRFADLTSVSH